MGQGTESENVPILRSESQNNPINQPKSESNIKQIDNSDFIEDDIKEGGWGWIVVAASFLCNMVIDGIGYSFGVLLEPISSEFKQSIGYVSFVGSILAGVILLTGPLAAASTNRFGTRITCILGSFISSGALLASSYSTNLEMLMVVYGVLGGFGLGLMYVPAVVAVGQFFSRRLSLATGISVCGSGAGTFIFAPMSAYFVQNFGWRGCNRILAIFCLCCFFCGLLMKEGPLSKSIKKEAKEEEESVTEKKSAGYMYLLKSLPFQLVMLGNLPTVMAVYITYIYIPAMAEAGGAQPSDASFIISVVGVTNTLGRILSGWLADLPCFSALAVTIVASVLASVFPVLMPVLSSSYLLLVTVSASFGLLLAAIPSVTSSLLVSLLGREHLNNSFGLLTFVRGVAAFMGPPLGGAALSHLNTMQAPFTLASLFLGCSGAVHAAVWLLGRRNSRQRQDYQKI